MRIINVGTGNQINVGKIVDSVIQQANQDVTTLNIGNGNRITGSIIGSGYSVQVRNRVAIIDGKEYPFLPSMRGGSTTMINNKIFIDGYELTKKGWKKTLRAVWHQIF